MGPNRCNYTPDVRGDPEAGKVTCWRPTYREYDRCIWHCTDGKSTAELAQYDLLPGERLDAADLRGLDFRGVDWLAGTTLIGADFSNANVSDADLSDTDLRKSSFDDATARQTDFTRSDLERADIRSADLRSADLRMARLDGTDLANSRITVGTKFGDQVIYETEIDTFTNTDRQRIALDTATRTYKKLERLSQDNSLSSQASHYYRLSKDIHRRFNWQTGSYLPALFGEASRWFTGYGNRPWRVILTSALVVLLAGVVYPLVGGLHFTADSGRPPLIVDITQASLGEAGHVLVESIFFSIVTFTTLGYGNLEPNVASGRYVAAGEAITGTVLLALFVGVLTHSSWLR